MKPTIIAQITDLHIRPPGELAYGRVDTATAFQALVVHLNALRPRPDLVVISGDLVDKGLPEEYAHLRQLLAPLAIPFAITPGNHDARDAMRVAFPEEPFTQGEALNQVRQVGPLDILLIDTLVEGRPYGELKPETLEWLDAALAADGERPAIIAMHHPPFPNGIWHMDRQPMRNPAPFAAILARHPRVRRVTCGHVHRNVIAMLGAVPVTICPAPNHAVVLDLDQSLAPSFAIEPPAFHLHVWLPEAAMLVTHQVPVGRFEGPYPFYNPDGALL